MVELGPDPHDSGIDGGQAKKNGFEQGGPAAGGTVEDDVRGELLKGFKSSESHKGRMEGFRLGGRTRMGLEVERFQERGGFSPRGRIMREGQMLGMGFVGRAFWSSFLLCLWVWAPNFG